MAAPGSSWPISRSGRADLAFTKLGRPARMANHRLLAVFSLAQGTLSRRPCLTVSDVVCFTTWLVDMSSRKPEHRRASQRRGHQLFVANWPGCRVARAILASCRDWVGGGAASWPVSSVNCGNRCGRCCRQLPPDGRLMGRDRAARWRACARTGLRGSNLCWRDTEVAWSS